MSRCWSPAGRLARRVRGAVAAIGLLGGLISGCGEAPPPSAEPDVAAPGRARVLEGDRPRRARYQRFFEICAMDEPSYRALQRLSSEPGAEPVDPPEPCRDFWAFKREFRLEHDCLQPNKPARCQHYFAQKKRFGL